MKAFAELHDLLRNIAAKIVNDDLEIFIKTKDQRLKKLALARASTPSM
jgi:hypothetical protein